MKKLILLVIMCMLFSGTATASKIKLIKSASEYIIKNKKSRGILLDNYGPRKLYRPRELYKPRESSPKAFLSKYKHKLKEVSSTDNVFKTLEQINEISKPAGKIIDATEKFIEKKCRENKREYRRYKLLC